MVPKVGRLDPFSAPYALLAVVKQHGLPISGSGPNIESQLAFPRGNTPSRFQLEQPRRVRI